NRFLQVGMSRWWIWELPSRRIIKTHQCPGDPLLPGLPAHITAIALSPDGNTLAWSDTRRKDEYVITVWDLVGDKTIMTFDTKKWVWDIAFSPDGHTLAAVGGYDSGCYWVWNLQLRRLVAADNKYGLSQLGGLSFSPDGRSLALAGGEEGFRFCDPETG